MILFANFYLLVDTFQSENFSDGNANFVHWSNFLIYKSTLFFSFHHWMLLSKIFHFSITWSPHFPLYLATNSLDFIYIPFPISLIVNSTSIPFCRSYVLFDAAATLQTITYKHTHTKIVCNLFHFQWMSSAYYILSWALFRLLLCLLIIPWLLFMVFYVFIWYYLFLYIISSLLCCVNWIQL